jgi:hypothetical protein
VTLTPRGRALWRVAALVASGQAGEVRVTTIGVHPPEPGNKVSLHVSGPVVAWTCTTS